MTLDLLIDANAEAAVRAVYAQHLRPAPVESVAVWADQFRQIAKGPEKGPWRTSRTPYLREPMECMSEGSPIERVVMQFATQLGKTEVLYNTILHRIHRSPQDMMMVQPTLGDAMQHSRERFMPTVRRMPEILKRLPKPTSRDASTSWGTKSLAGGSTLFFAGANSARSLASKPLGLVVCDEIDGYPMDVDGEGDPLTLIGERMSNFSNRKLLLCSTPTVKDFSRIEAEYLASDRRRFWVPCPHCGEFQVLEWGADAEHGIKWKKTDAGEPRPETAHYVCRHHGCVIEEHGKTVMLSEGVWRPDAPGAGGGLVAGFHLSKLYSPIGWRSWPWIVRAWLEAKAKAQAGDVTKLKAFINTSLAETWEDQGEKADGNALAQRAEDYPLRTVPWGGLAITGSTDVQDDRLECYAWAWGRGEESWLVDRRVLWGDPAIQEGQPGSLWDEVTAWRREVFRHAGGAAMKMSAHAVDSGGHHTQAVYSYARRHAAEKVLAIKGESQRARAILGKPVEVETNHRGKKVRRGVKRWPVGTDTAKSVVYGRLRLTAAGPGYVHFSRELPGEVYQQITAERLVTKYVKGRARREWLKPPGRRNEALDCAVYALAAAHFLGLHRYTADQWNALEQGIAKAATRQAIKEVTMATKGNEPVKTSDPEPSAGTLAPEMRVDEEPAEPAPPAPTVEAPPPRPPARRKRPGWHRKTW